MRKAHCHGVPFSIFATIQKAFNIDYKFNTCIIDVYGGAYERPRSN